MPPFSASTACRSSRWRTTTSTRSFWRGVSSRRRTPICGNCKPATVTPQRSFFLHVGRRRLEEQWLRPCYVPPPKADEGGGRLASPLPPYLAAPALPQAPREE